MLLKEWWWRVRWCWYFRKGTGWHWLDCWDAAWAGDYAPEYSPREAVEDELPYWSEV